MLSDVAPQNYRRRVVLEKERTQALMSAQDPAIRAAWATVKVTRRFAFTKDTEVLAWKAEGSEEPLAKISVLSAEFDYLKGFSARVAVTSAWSTSLGVKTVGRTPVEVVKGVFVSLDTIEPFIQDGGDETRICLIVYSQAGVNGHWPKGVVAGTLEEFEIYGVSGA